MIPVICVYGLVWYLVGWDPVDGGLIGAAVYLAWVAIQWTYKGVTVLRKKAPPVEVDDDGNPVEPVVEDGPEKAEGPASPK